MTQQKNKKRRWNYQTNKNSLLANICIYFLLLKQILFRVCLTSFSISTDRAAKIDLIKLNGKPALPDGTPYGNTPLRSYSYQLPGNFEPVLYRYGGEQNINNIEILSTSVSYECICESIIFLQWVWFEICIKWTVGQILLIK